MTKLSDIAQKIRSKNAGPFWLTIDIFCGSDPGFGQISKGLKTADVAAALGTQPDAIKRFDIAAQQVIKISLARPETQGAPRDRDMHGASFAALLAELNID